jgi:hypothetical protein
MIPLVPWIQREWSFDLPLGAYPAVLERLRGTPVRAEALFGDLPDSRLSERPLQKWSAKEHVGHLNDIHALDRRRLEEFLARVEILTAADMSNRTTHEGRHRATPAPEILATFRRQRGELIAELERLTEADIAATAMHPRLGLRIRLIDWAEFVAEHDDHHLASARNALSAAGITTR